MEIAASALQEIGSITFPEDTIKSRISADREAIDIIDRYLAAPVDRRGREYCKTKVVAMFELWSFIMTDGARQALEEAMPQVNAIEAMKVARQNLVNRIAVFEAALEKLA